MLRRRLLVGELVVEEALLEVGCLDLDLDRVAQAEDLAGALAADQVVLLVEVEEVGLDEQQPGQKLRFVASAHGKWRLSWTEPRSEGPGSRMEPSIRPPRA